MINNWRKSSFTEGNAACVELGYDSTTSGVRDSKNAQGPVLEFSGRRPITDLLTAVKTGRIG